MKHNLPILQCDEWIEDNGKIDSKYVQNRIINNERFYCINFNTHAISQLRISSLVELLKYLKMKGDVYLLRMPIDRNLIAINNTFDPEANDRMKQISSGMEIYYYYFNLNEQTFGFMDVVHLTLQLKRYLKW